MPDDHNAQYSQAIDKAAAKDPQILMILINTQNESRPKITMLFTTTWA